jgi:hypothetical protein
MPKKKRKPLPIIYDCRHRRVPGALIKTFQGRNKMLAICARLEYAQNEISLQYGLPQARDCDVIAIRQIIEIARVAILKSLPYMVCQCSTRECQTCGGRRWLSVKEFQELSKLQRWRH